MSIKFAQLACRLFLAAAMSGPAFAQDTLKSGEPSLRDALEAAWAKSARLPAATGRLRVATANRVAAEAFWAASPSLEVGLRGDPFVATSGQRETEVGLAWPLLLPGQRFARGASADADVRTAQATQKAALLLVAGDVRESAWAAHAQRSNVAIAEAQARAMEALAADVDRRVAAGDLARADALAARAEALAAGAAVSTERQQLEGAMSRWTLLTGLRLVSESVEVESRADIDEHPELILDRLKVESARKRVELVRLSRRAPPELVVRYRHDLPAGNLASQDTLGVALRIPFATEDRNLPVETAALAEADLALVEERRTRERLESGLALARAALSAAVKQLALEDSRAAMLSERARLVEISFRAGETALPELLRTTAAAAQAERSRARQHADLGLARARVRQAGGLLP